MVNGLLIIGIGLFGSLEVDLVVEEVGTQHHFNIIHQVENPIFCFREEFLFAGSELKRLTLRLDFSIGVLDLRLLAVDQGHVLFGCFIVESIE